MGSIDLPPARHDPPCLPVCAPCTAAQPRPYHPFSTMTAYHAPLPASPLQPPTSRHRLRSVVMLVRHGARNPVDGAMRRFDLLTQWLQDCVPACAASEKRLARWKGVVDAFRADLGGLVPAGAADMTGIALRFAHVYGAPLTAAHARLLLSSTYKARVVDSAHAFLHALLSAPALLPTPAVSLMAQAATVNVAPRQSPDNLVLRFYDAPACAAFAHAHRHAARKLHFTDPPCMRRLRARVATTLRATCPPCADAMRALGAATAFARALKRPYSHPSFDDGADAEAEEGLEWPAGLLTEREIQELERAEDATRPFVKAHALFPAVTTPLTASIAAALRRADPVADVRFAHAETLAPLLLLLQVPGAEPCDLFCAGADAAGAVDAVPLARLTPFAANVAIEVFEPDEEEVDAWYQHVDDADEALPPLLDRCVVRVRHNERYVDVHALGDKWIAGEDDGHGHGAGAGKGHATLLDFLQFLDSVGAVDAV